MSREHSVNELKNTFSVLDDDVKAVQKLVGNDVSAFHVRMSIRAYSALIEGLLYQMRQVALHSANGVHKIFELEERLVLSEKSLSLDKKGNVKKKGSFYNALPMLLFTLQQYPKIHGVDFRPDTNDHGWECMQKFITVRNRVVHPKSINDLELASEEWKEINKGIDWFYSTVKSMFSECAKADEYHRNRNV